MSESAIRTRAPITFPAAESPSDVPSRPSPRAGTADSAAQVRPAGLEEIFQGDEIRGGDIARCNPERLDFAVRFATMRAVENGFSFVDGIKLRNYDPEQVEKILRDRDPTGKLGLVDKWSAYRQLTERVQAHLGDDGKVDRNEYADLAQRAEQLGIPQSELRQAVEHLENGSRPVPDFPHLRPPHRLPNILNPSPNWPPSILKPLPQPQPNILPWFGPAQPPSVRPMPKGPAPTPVPAELLIPLGSKAS